MVEVCILILYFERLLSFIVDEIKQVVFQSVNQLDYVRGGGFSFEVS